MNLLLLLLVLICVLLCGLQTFGAAQKLGTPPFLSALLWSSFIIFAGSLLCGAVGHYAPLPVTISVVCLSALSIFGIWKFTRVLPRFPVLQFNFALIHKGPWSSITALLSLVSLLLLYPYVQCFWKLSQLLFTPTAELGWDAVSYHLPALIEFVQAHSFWTFEGPYQSYSFGFELIYGLSILFCHSHWSVIIGHGLSIVLLLLSTSYVVKQLLDTLEACGLERQNRVMVHLLVQGIWAGIVFRTSLDGVGNNDVFEAAMLLSAFGYFMDFFQRGRTEPALRYFLICLGTMSFTLALATKPPALLFTPLFLVMAVTEKSENRLGLKLNIMAALKAVPLLAMVVAVGAFFLWHNIPKFGGICDPALACGFRDTLLHHLRDPRLFVPTPGSVLFFASGLLSLPLFLYLWKLATGGRDAPSAAPLIWVSLLYLTGAAAFSYTPFGVTPDYDSNVLTRLFFQDRKAMVMYMAAAFAIALSVDVLCAKLAKKSDQSQQGKIRAHFIWSLARRSQPLR